MSDNDRRSKIWITGPKNRRNLASYAHRHNYSLIRKDNITLNLALKEYTKVWAKVDVLIKHLNYSDWLLWIDSDLLIMNFERRLETFIPRNDHIDIVITADKLGINAGIFFWRNSPSGREIFEKWKLMATSHSHEQRQLASLIKTDVNISRRVLILPLCAFNSYMIANYLTTHYEYGDFAVHFAGAAWNLETHIFNKYGWDLFNHFADLASTDGVTLKK
ncbi:unnamed protein product [Rotaria socialis]